MRHADILSVSTKGELAVLLEKPGGLGRGTLARIPLEGGTPREVLEDVTDAGWAPNGEDLAVRVRHDPNGIVHLEYPIGTVLGEGDWFAFIRVSPKGDLVAYYGKGEKGTSAIKTIDRRGKVRIVSDGWQNFDGARLVGRGRRDRLRGQPSRGQSSTRSTPCRFRGGSVS